MGGDPNIWEVILTYPLTNPEMILQVDNALRAYENPLVSKALSNPCFCQGCVGGGKVDRDQISANAKTKGTITEEQVVAQVLPSLQSLARIDAGHHRHTGYPLSNTGHMEESPPGMYETL